MRWPWVSRAHYELLEHNYGELRDRCRNAETRETLQSHNYELLSARYHALKLMGATAPEPIVPIERKGQDEVTRRINILSVGRPGLRAQMLRQAESDRTLHGMSDIAILQRIEAGVTADEGIPA